MLFDGLKHAAEVQKYNITPEVAFLCPHEQEEPSQAAEESQPSSLPPHLATVTRNKQRIRCKLDKRISMPFGSHTLQANQPSPMLQQTMKTDLCYFNIFLSSDGKMTMDAIGDSTSWTRLNTSGEL